MASEKDLALDNEDHEKFAEAMLLCQNGAGWCIYSGRCFYDGDCFRTDVSAYSAAARKIRALADKETGMIQAALVEAATHMDTMKNMVKGGKK